MEQIRLIAAVIVSTIVLIAWQYFFSTPSQEHKQENVIERSIVEPKIVNELSREDILKQDETQRMRVSFFNDYIEGSINLKGAKIDDLILSRYKKDIHSPENVVLLSPAGASMRYLADFGWLKANYEDAILPNDQTVWSVHKHTHDKIELYWNNNSGLRFSINVSLDNKYMFEIKQTVANNSNKSVSIHCYAAINRSYGQTSPENRVVHEGALSVINHKFLEKNFDDMSSQTTTKKIQDGWIGFSDKYWLVSIIPDHNDVFYAKFSKQLNNYQGDVLSEIIVLPQGAQHTKTLHLFTGPKVISILHTYQDLYSIEFFDRAVDFGMLYFITKPIFMLLSYLYSVLHNLGIAILVLTVLIKLCLFPLAYKGFVSMNKMKDVQPKMTQLKERYKEDNAGFQKALLALYKSEKINPMSGCLPILLQMPIFFALYKALSVTIEMRQAPFFGWIKDLSAQDTTTIFNLFGLIPWHVPSFLMIGILPLLMALSMHIQQSLNPAPADATQAKVMKFLPVIFIFLFSSFPSGLLVYWTWSNILSIVQQIIIKKLVK